MTNDQRTRDALINALHDSFVVWSEVEALMGNEPYQNIPKFLQSPLYAGAPVTVFETLHTLNQIDPDAAVSYIQERFDRADKWIRQQFLDSWTQPNQLTTIGA